MKEKTLITSALLYANGSLHFGHIAGAYLPADCYARFKRGQGADVLYISGSDEYGIAITLKAELAKRTPREQVDLFHEVNKKLFQQLNFSFDHYSRTTWEGHKEPAQQFFTDLYNNQYIEKKVSDQLYSKEENRFFADRYVTGTCPDCAYDKARGDECPKCGASYDAIELKNPRSKLSGKPLSTKQATHWFLLLDRFKDDLLKWLKTKNWKSNVINFVRKYIENLHPRAITRDTSWGIPVPLDEAKSKVLYVWFDAPIGYISASKEWAQKIGDPDRWKKYWMDENTQLIHFIGKDNIPFHSVIFPAMTMGQNQPYKLVDELPANEFYNLEGKKFSKSDGWYIDLHEFFKSYSADQIRYTIAATAPETSDSEFTWKIFQQKCNHDLLGKFGNLVHRTFVFTHKQYGPHSPTQNPLSEIDRAFEKKIQELTEQVQDAYATFSTRKASTLLMELAQEANVYFDSKAPWKLAKSEETRPAMASTLAYCLECIKRLAILSSPIIPDSAQKLWKMLGYTTSLEKILWKDALNAPIPPEQTLKKPEILFAKIEDDQIKKEEEKLHQMSEKASLENRSFTPLKELVDIESFRKLDIRIGVILEAEKVPKSKKLLKLKVDLGFEKRIILSGINKFYSTDQLVGQKVTVLVNLNPVTIMGIQSEGMILTACDSKEQLELLSSTTSLPGSTIS